MRVYCLTCEVLVCSLCISLGQHVGHTAKIVKEAAEESRAELTQLRVQTGVRLGQWIQQYEALRRSELELQHNQEAFLLQLQSDFGMLHVALDRKERELVAALRGHVDERLQQIGEMLVSCRERSADIQGRQYEAEAVLGESDLDMLHRLAAVKASLSEVTAGTGTGTGIGAQAEAESQLLSEAVPASDLAYPIDEASSDRISEEASAGWSAELVALWAAEDRALGQKGAALLQRRTPRPGRVQISKDTGALMDQISSWTIAKYLRNKYEDLVVSREQSVILLTFIILDVYL